MEYKTEFRITLPEELLNALGIDEDTLFETYFDTGSIKVRVLDEDDFENEFEDEDDDEVPEECDECPHYCWHCGVCSLDE